MGEHILPLDPNQRSHRYRWNFRRRCGRKSSARTKVWQALVDLYQVFCAGLNHRDGQWGICSSWGRQARARRALWKRARRFCSATPRSLIKVDCAEFQHSHEMRSYRLAPGVFGHRETHPLITQKNWRRAHTDKPEAVVFAFR